jgi:hypothetical protein
MRCCDRPCRPLRCSERWFVDPGTCDGCKTIEWDGVGSDRLVDFDADRHLKEQKVLFLQGSPFDYQAAKFVLQWE